MCHLYSPKGHCELRREQVSIQVKFWYPLFFLLYRGCIYIVHDDIIEFSLEIWHIRRLKLIAANILRKGPCGELVWLRIWASFLPGLSQQVPPEWACKEIERSVEGGKEDMKGYVFFLPPNIYLFYSGRGSNQHSIAIHYVADKANDLVGSTRPHRRPVFSHMFLLLICTHVH